MSLNCVTGAAALDELPHAHWLGVAQAQDAADTMDALSDHHTWDWLIVDHYALDERWESLLRAIVDNILVIDDLADRRHDCDLLLDQNLYRDMNARYSDLVPERCRLLLGPRYALLREEFRSLRAHVKPRTGEIKRILVFLGGIDITNYTAYAISALSGMQHGKFQVDVVIGAQHPHREQIVEMCINCHYTCYIQTQLMAKLMAAADLAIGAGGSASWERCCLGLPALTVLLADNQIETATALSQYGACRLIDLPKLADTTILQKAVTDLITHPTQLAMLSEKAYTLVDGLGVHWVSQAMG